MDISLGILTQHFQVQTHIWPRLLNFKQRFQIIGPGISALHHASPCEQPSLQVLAAAASVQSPVQKAGAGLGLFNVTEEHERVESCLTIRSKYG